MRQYSVSFATPLALCIASIGVWTGCSSAPPAARPSQTTELQPVAATETSQESNVATEKAMFGAGCFWGVEETFRQIEGVVATAVGYSGGHTENPTYKEVCSDRTGHAEVVLVEFDPEQVSYAELLDVFWANHNPTLLNRQGPDVGSQYRSAVFYFSPEQQAVAGESKQALAASGKWDRPIVTEISPAKPFYMAEEYHQQYLAKRGQSSCATTIRE